jgi:hypothetical protein
MCTMHQGMFHDVFVCQGTTISKLTAGSDNGRNGGLLSVLKNGKHVERAQESKEEGGILLEGEKS